VVLCFKPQPSDQYNRHQKLHLSLNTKTLLIMPLYYNSNDEHIKRIVSRCPTLHETYKPPWWCISPWINVVVMLIKERFASNMELQRDTIICPDGGKWTIMYLLDNILTFYTFVSDCR